MNKIVGFLFTSNREFPKVDFFEVNFSQITIEVGSNFLHLWGHGDILQCKIGSKFSLGWPVSGDLCDRNVLLEIIDKVLIVENDWLGSIPIFYNLQRKTISTLCNLCLGSRSIDPSGLKYFCEFGYSAFETTIFEEVHFLRYSSRLLVRGEIILEYKIDPVPELMGEICDQPESDIINGIKSDILAAEARCPGGVILPVSGGFDSRLIASLLAQPERVKAYSYGVGKAQRNSRDVVIAKIICEKMSIDWEFVELGNYINLTSKWFDLFGFSTHLHGMYHLDFYQNIRKKHCNTKNLVFSGIVGDIWSGNLHLEGLSKPADVSRLAFHHGLAFPTSQILSSVRDSSDNLSRDKFVIDQYDIVRDDAFNVVATVRLKIILLSYLMQLPEYMGFVVATPFLSARNALKMVGLSPSRRVNREWQRDYFENEDLYPESAGVIFSRGSGLEFDFVRSAKIEPINEEIMGKFIKLNRIRSINDIMSGRRPIRGALDRLLYVRKIAAILKKLKFSNNTLRAYFEYSVLKSIEMGIANDS